LANHQKVKRILEMRSVLFVLIQHHLKI